MKSRITLALAVVALSFGIVNLASAAQTPKWCQDICAVVRCASTAPTCGLYVDGSGNVVCGCH
jgi:hypothetical protein